MDHQQQQEEEETPCVPPGFRFHPTEEELVGYYLARKVASQKIDLDIIREVDLYRIEPWDLQERCSGGAGACAQQQQEEEPTTTEYYFFSYKDRKYPSGTRSNRATAAGFWKATGRDKPVRGGSTPSSRAAVVIGMRKTLVFYRGRAPNGRRTDWIIHEYRLQSDELAPTQEEGWVVCRAFQKPVPNHHHQHHHHYHQRRISSYYSGYGGGNMAGAGSYYYDHDGAPNNNNDAQHARLLMRSRNTAATAAPAPKNDDHGLLLLAVAESSKLQVQQLLADMPPPLQSPSVGESYEHEQAAAAAAMESTTAVDYWNLLSSLLAPSSSQL